MRCVLVLVVLLGGCGVDPVGLTSIVGGVAVASVVVIHRTPLDALWSLVTGHDCSVVRLDQGKGYCRPEEPPPEPPPYCTRSLGVADCWAAPADGPSMGREVSDGPRVLTPAQEANRTRRWPF